MNIIFKKILIVDILNKFAKKVEFSNEKNLVTSPKNGKGKSTIIKSLYHALGANGVFDTNIELNTMLFEIEFMYNEQIYKVVRYRENYLIFKNNIFIKIIREDNIIDLSDFYKNELGLYVYLKNRSGTIELAPPAYSFIPYYLDQDNSWKGDVLPFNNLGQFKKEERNNLFYYHLDLYTEKYSENKSRLSSKQSDLTSLNNKIKKLDELYVDIKKELSLISVVENVEDLEITLRNYNESLQEIIKAYNDCKNKLFKIESEHSSNVMKIKEIVQFMDKIKRGEKKEKPIVKCPICENEFEIDLKESILQLYNIEYLNNRKVYYEEQNKELENDILKFKKQLIELLDKIKNKEREIFSEKSTYENFVRRKSIENLLLEKEKQIGKLTVEVNKLNKEIDELKETIRKYDINKAQVDLDFKEKYSDKLKALAVKRFNASRIKAFDKLAIGGSQYVRSTLALYFSFIELKEQMNVNKFMCPLVIDSPREGEQDDMNSKIILEFIFENYNSNYQLIVSSVNADKYLDLNDKYNNVNVVLIDGEDNQVMTKEDYDTNELEINNIKSYFGL